MGALTCPHLSLWQACVRRVPNKSIYARTITSASISDALIRNPRWQIAPAGFMLKFGATPTTPKNSLCTPKTNAPPPFRC